MELDWRGRLILRKLTEGLTIRESAAAVGITRQAILKRKNASLDFAQAVAAAREAGREERVYRIWLRPSVPGAQAAYGSGDASCATVHLNSRDSQSLRNHAGRMS